MTAVRERVCRLRARRTTLLAFAVSFVACRSQAPADALVAPASPQASAEPAPLANLPTPLPSNVAPLAAGPDAGPPPLPMRGDRPVAPDVPARDLTPTPFAPAARESVGYTMQAALHVSDVAPPQKLPETSAAGLEAARKRLEPKLTIDMVGARMRILVSGPFVLPLETEIRARADRYGHVVLSPGGTTYRIAAPGALRAVIGERRFDVAPLLVPELVAHGEAPKRLSLRVRKVDVATRAAKATFEIARAEGLAEAGTLLCRALLDLMNAPPSTPLCAVDEVPVRAELRWTTRGAFTFEAVSLTRRTDIPSYVLATPPVSAAFADTPLPAQRADVLLFQPELAALRTAPFDAPLPSAPFPADVEGGLLLVNATDQLRFAWLEGMPIAWLAPGTRMRVAGLQRGRYTLQWRTFLGDAFEPAQPATVPGVAQLGGADGGLAL